MEEEFKTQRHGGGQPGNLNALKHGFYSKMDKKTETEDLECMGGEGLEDEIEMMRIITRRFLELAQKANTMHAFMNPENSATHGLYPVASKKEPFRRRKGSYPVYGGFTVDLRGFEPLASSVRLRRAPNCATGPSSREDKLYLRGG